MLKKTRAIGLASAAALSLSVAACGTGDGSSGGPGDQVTLQYWLWDDLQQPAYQACADAFTEENPGITIEISQTAWNEYWQNLTTQLASGSAPDVWTNQASYYPQFVTNNQILDIQPFVEADGIDTTQYVAGLADIYVKDDARYGLPKDWDTIALVYNTQMLQDAGIDAATMQDLTWNPADGGTFEEAIAQLTIDSEGRNGLDPDFDKENVEVHGFLPEWADGSQGQNGWGNLAVSNGFTYVDETMWGTEFSFDDPALAETMTWYRDLIEKGYAPSLDVQSTMSRDTVMADGASAVTTLGSWAINSYTAGDTEFAFAPLPVGPEGRKSAINGLSDAIWAGTEHPEEAWEWVKFLASPDCQNIVADEGVVFPALQESSERALAAREASGVDVSVFTETAAADGGTFFLPVTEHGNEISQIIQDAMQSIALGQGEAGPTLETANETVNALFD
jgi:multiple sugar transport system substrate-binding protein